MVCCENCDYKAWLLVQLVSVTGSAIVKVLGCCYEHLLAVAHSGTFEMSNGFVEVFYCCICTVTLVNQFCGGLQGRGKY